MKIHLLGVGGVGMGNLACMLKQSGHKVTGSDKAIYPPMSGQLKRFRIQVRTFSVNNIKNTDLYIIGNVISRGNPEAEEILNRGFSYTSMPQALADFFLKGKQVIVIAGTHGKTTTAFLLDHLLSTGHQSPGFFAGGMRNDGMNGYRISDSPYFIIEGDEYDSAFFDKSSKFLHYRPRYLLLTSVDFDHADIFENLKEYKKSFSRLLRMIPANGVVIACHENRGVRTILKEYKYSPVIWYDEKNGNFDFLNDPEVMPLMGKYNRLNAAGALKMALHLKFNIKELKKALPLFPGVMRRQQILAEVKKSRNGGPIILIEDFAHHPVAVRETIVALRQKYPNKIIHALFEPRSASSHRKIFQNDYIRALRHADHVYLCEVYNKHKVEEQNLLNTAEIVDRLKENRNARGTKAFHCKTPKNVLSNFKKYFSTSRRGDIILVMSNGSFGGIYKELAAFVRRQ